MSFNIAPDPTSKQQKKTIFFWIDILGFSDRLEKNTEYGKLKEDLEYFRNSFRDEMPSTNIIISDGLLIQLNDYTQIETSIQKLAEKQKKFILEKKEFIRGGVAVGIVPNEKDVGNDIILTDGLSKAVKIESKKVSWPVIATDEKNLKEIKDLIKTGNDLGLKKGFNERGEKIHFFDFISGMDSVEKKSYLAILNEKINEYSDDPDKKNKYLWLLRHFYHIHGQTDYQGICQELQGVVL